MIRLTMMFMCRPFLQATFSFSYADHLDLDTAILRATLFVLLSAIGLASPAPLT